MTYIDKVIEKINSNNRKKIVLPESEDDRVLIAASKATDIADIYLIGNEDVINDSAKRLNIDLSKVTIINPSTYERTEEMVNKLY
jgi:phosphate acetyltransferase